MFINKNKILILIQNRFSLKYKFSHHQTSRNFFNHKNLKFAPNVLNLQFLFFSHKKKPPESPSVDQSTVPRSDGVLYPGPGSEGVEGPSRNPPSYVEPEKTIPEKRKSWFLLIKSTFTTKTVLKNSRNAKIFDYKHFIIERKSFIMPLVSLSSLLTFRSV